ncbi:MAG: D-tagatose-bisphosphate aldolase, class II, non-catalytic subunit [Rhodanobacteraceae bacterium]|nr:D-tagatose-bisphosphate aldolase, class II, non-catalytic subunit [Rhodanobacteraceae bacterium]
MTPSPIQTLLQRHRNGERSGVYSVCSSHPQVLRAAMDVAQRHDTPLLVEATSNQVDQFGGYTGMQPAQFRDWLWALADEHGFDRTRLVLGGDHLGPNAWQAQAPATAMAHARDLIAAYASAGFHKIHLDCSMSCAGDPTPLPDATVAARAAELAQVAEQAAAAAGLPPPLYVIGTEVPIPGGEASLQGGVAVTQPAAAAATLEVHREVFARAGLDGAWQRVIALVVQPGVDFDHSSVQHYAPAAARALSQWLEAQPRIVFEAHSTDYQRERALHELVRDHFAILKVGPAATFALREALFALAAIEAEWLPSAQCSQLPEVLDRRMCEEPRHWRRHYQGDAPQLRLLRRYALSDRCRYYWGDAQVRAAVERLVANLRATPPPLTLLSQFLPDAHRAVVDGGLDAEPLALVRHHIAGCLAPYARACSANAAPR